MLVCNGSSWNISNICWAVGNSIVLVASQTTIVSGYCCKKCYYHGYRTSLSGIIIGSMIEIETKEDNGHSLYGCDFIDGVGGIVCSRTIYKRYMQSTSAWIWSWIRILQFRSMRKYHSGHCQIRQLKNAASRNSWSLYPRKYCRWFEERSSVDRVHDRGQERVSNDSGIFSDPLHSTYQVNFKYGEGWQG